ncbi:hypothetical protein MOV08_05090 [Streptomyces yunnanensis]|uniref:Uncharacterized protein n=1 Tax=Streptomyces yunnanensis TaxID=156453 RepID=A0ABY8A1D7_9ACTN|nr:hypothetical protein [Streptomyces yunnanensis]WEB38738.1 hypothetical protein MOV08_05090 [Streptomyces yunnanensis]
MNIDVQKHFTITSELSPESVKLLHDLVAKEIHTTDMTTVIDPNHLNKLGEIHHQLASALGAISE